MRDFSELKGRIKAKNLTQKDVAKALGVSEVTVGKKLRGEKPTFDLDDRDLIMDLLDIEEQDESKYFPKHFSCRNT